MWESEREQWASEAQDRVRRLRRQVRASQYVVDSDAVADALLRRRPDLAALLVSPGLGLGAADERLSQGPSAESD